MSIFDKVLTTQEVAKLLKLNDSTIRRNVINGKYNRKKYEKRGNVILFERSYIDDLIKK